MMIMIPYILDQKLISYIATHVTRLVVVVVLLLLVFAGATSSYKPKASSFQIGSE